MQVLGPAAPPALAILGLQGWLLLELFSALRTSRAIRHTPYASACRHDTTVECRIVCWYRTGCLCTASCEVRCLHHHVTAGGGTRAPSVGELALMSALWLCLGRLFFFVTAHAHSFERLHVTASFVPSHTATVTDIARCVARPYLGSYSREPCPGACMLTPRTHM